MTMTSSMREHLRSRKHLDYFWYRGRNRPLIPGKNEKRNDPLRMFFPKQDLSLYSGQSRNYTGVDLGFSAKDFSHGSSSDVKSADIRAWKTERHKTRNCHQFLRYATLVFTIIVFVAGAAMLGLGIYLLGSDYGARQLSEVLGNDLYQVGAFVLVGAGGVLILMSMCGCCGAIRESKFMLGCFILILSILILALVAAAAVVFVFRQKMEGDIIHSMEDVLIEKYGVDLENSENRMVTDMWNWLQRELNCCGVTGNANETTSWAIYKHSTWYKGFETGKPYVPQSCCKEDGDINKCTGITPVNGPPSKGPPILDTMDHNENLYKKGCYDELVHYIQNHAVLIGVSAIAAVVVMLFGLVFSLYLCRRIDYDDY